MSFSYKLKEELLSNLKIQNDSKDILEDKEKILEIFKSAQKEQNKETKQELYSKFLALVFIKCGNITNPENEYHMEFDLTSPDLCDAIMHAFEHSDVLGFSPSLTERRNHFVIYLKDNQKITDFLVFIGAQKAAMEIMQIKMIKEIRNNINRSTNFETANLSRVTNSSTQHIAAINKIKESIGIEELPEHLRETALLRIMNPYMSLNDLSRLYEKPISKSGINHRLKKIMDIAKEIK